jgi:CRP-like cAMP-binding protein
LTLQFNRGQSPVWPARGAPSPSSIVARRLAAHSLLGPPPEVLDKLLGQPVDFKPRTLIAEVGDAPRNVTVLREGWACRMTLLPNGRRQIHAILLPGDTADVEATLLEARPDNIEALSRCSVWSVPHHRLASLAADHPDLASAFAREAAIAANVARAWVVNIGQRDAIQRIAHFICELHARLSAVGAADPDGFTLGATQGDIADAQGLTTVHVNRVLQDLRARGLIRIERRRLTIVDGERLQALALFDPLYLHLGASVKA